MAPNVMAPYTYQSEQSIYMVVLSEFAVAHFYKKHSCMHEPKTHAYTMCTHFAYEVFSKSYIVCLCKVLIFAYRITTSFVYISLCF